MKASQKEWFSLWMVLLSGVEWGKYSPTLKLGESALTRMAMLHSRLLEKAAF